jgi:hypothetical protein
MTKTRLDQIREDLQRGIELYKQGQNRALEIYGRTAHIQLRSPQVPVSSDTRQSENIKGRYILPKPNRDTS